jgi:hypothetical protein
VTLVVELVLAGTVIAPVPLQLATDGSESAAAPTGCEVAAMLQVRAVVVAKAATCSTCAPSDRAASTRLPRLTASRSSSAAGAGGASRCDRGHGRCDFRGGGLAASIDSAAGSRHLLSATVSTSPTYRRKIQVGEWIFYEAS